MSKTKKKYTIVICRGTVWLSNPKLREKNKPVCKIIEAKGHSAKDILYKELSMRYFNRKTRHMLTDWIGEVVEIEGGLYLQDAESDIYIIEKK